MICIEMYIQHLSFISRYFWEGGGELKKLDAPSDLKKCFPQIMKQKALTLPDQYCRSTLKNPI